MSPPSEDGAGLDMRRLSRTAIDAGDRIPLGHSDRARNVPTGPRVRPKKRLRSAGRSAPRVWLTIELPLKISLAAHAAERCSVVGFNGRLGRCARSVVEFTHRLGSCAPFGSEIQCSTRTAVKVPVASLDVGSNLSITTRTAPPRIPHKGQRVIARIQTAKGVRLLDGPRLKLGGGEK